MGKKTQKTSPPKKNPPQKHTECPGRFFENEFPSLPKRGQERGSTY